MLLSKLYGESITRSEDCDLVGEARACEQLWCAVLATLITDSMRMPRPGTDSADEADRQAAVAWFERGGADFQAVCLLAGFDPRMVQERWRRAMTAVEQAQAPVSKRWGVPTQTGKSRLRAAFGA